jgi:endonuclease YncB( thermonuclease family)
VAEVYHRGDSINLRMVRGGLAVIYPRYLDLCSSTRTAYISAESSARRFSRGIWSLRYPTTVNVPYPGCLSGRRFAPLALNSEACQGR